MNSGKPRHVLSRNRLQNRYELPLQVQHELIHIEHHRGSMSHDVLGKSYTQKCLRINTVMLAAHLVQEARSPSYRAPRINKKKTSAQE